MNYLIKTGLGSEYYFSKPYEGICMKRCSYGGKFGEHNQIMALGREPFSVMRADDGRIHLVSVDAQNRLIYGMKQNGIWKRHTLSAIPADVTVLNMRLYDINNRLNLLYSAKIGGEILLVHCILAGHAKPTTVAKLYNSYFFLWRNKVYFTNRDGTLGFLNLEDEKPDFFTRLYDNAQNPFLWEICGRETLAFIRDSRLFIGGKEILTDERIENPVFVKGADRLYIMWKSGSFIRYISSFNDGTTWSEAMRFVGTETDLKLYTLQSGEDFSFYYGYESGNVLTLLGASNIFMTTESSVSYDELKTVKRLLEQKTKEAHNARCEVERLNKILSGLLP